MALRRTKIVATLGPASASEEVMEQLIRAGVGAARVNFSHGTHAANGALIDRIRAVASRLGKPVPIIQDIQGPKIRVGVLPEGSVTLRAGDRVTLVAGETTTDPSVIPVTYEYLHQDAVPGASILLDDGYLEVKVEAIEGREVQAQVVTGGLLKSNKGVNLPGMKLSINAITEKDIQDIKFGQKMGVEYVAASFIRAAKDLKDVRSHLVNEEVRTKIIAKIELREALENIEEIIRETDVIMLARGDLGVELPPEEVPMVQKELLQMCTLLGVPVITATQMLESMITNPRPTRAEASDVANAILDGTAATMLSAETASGKYPVEAVKTMARIAARAEEAVLADPYATQRRRAMTLRTVQDSVAHATMVMAEDLEAKAILVLTNTGNTAAMVSKYKPRVPILAMTPHERTYRQLNLLWGVTPLLAPAAATQDAMHQAAIDAALKAGHVQRGDAVVLCSGRVGQTGGTNTVRAVVVGQGS